MIDPDLQDFIAASTLLFITSRNAEGRLDVSPRGGQPSVLLPGPEGTLLLPDLKGNRRLDTIGNILAHDEVALLLLNRGSDRIVEVRARARLSSDPAVLACFPADEFRPVSVIVLTLQEIHDRRSPALARAGFWIAPEEKKGPLDLATMVGGDKVHFREVGEDPVRKEAGEEALLDSAGVRAVYGSPSEGVQTKVTRGAGPGAASFLAEASLIVAAREVDGVLRLDLHGGTPLRPAPEGNDPTRSLEIPAGMVRDGSGETGVLAVAPGRNETLRVNGRIDPAATARLLPREVFFHCSLSFGRSLIWDRTDPAPWTGRRRFTCTAVQRETAEVMSFTLTPDDAAPLGPVRAGQYVSISLPGDPVVPARRRSYSVSGSPAPRSLRITVRRTGAGGLSDLLHDSLRPGGTVLVGTPAGRFVLDSAPERKIALVSAGVGITPLLPMLDRLADMAEGPEVSFIHAAREPGAHLFEAEARAIADRAGGRIRVLTAYSRAEADVACDLRGRIDAARLAAWMPVAETDFYLCGPQDFMDDLTRDLTALGALPGSVRVEGFGADREAEAAAFKDRAPCRVTFRQSGIEAEWTPARGTLLDLALAEGIDIAHSCRMGDCQSCLLKMPQGRADYPGMTFPGPGSGRVLMCRAVPDGDVVIDG
jgi:ferredoxin-NADP reductase/predicted pyridoxine 5'-phosphate oxidase superfamily flavin-nucleotide-binding protein